MLLIVSSPSDSRVYAPRCWRARFGLIRNETDEWCLMERFYVNALAKEAIRADMHRRNAALQRRRRAQGLPSVSVPASTSG